MRSGLSSVKENEKRSLSSQIGHEEGKEAAIPKPINQLLDDGGQVPKLAAH